MTRTLTTGEAIKPLRNVASLMKLATTLDQTTFGLPRLGVFHGPAGLGKTFACASACAAFDGIYIEMEPDWTARTLYSFILRELGIRATGTVSERSDRCKTELMKANRLLVIDEADYMIKKRSSPMVDRVRSLHDKCNIPIILIGMEELPQKLRQWEQFDSRIYDWVKAEPADRMDAKMLADHYAPGIEISDGLIERVRIENAGVARNMAKQFGHIFDRCRQMGITKISRETWGDAPFLRTEAPTARRIA